MTTLLFALGGMVLGGGAVWASVLLGRRNAPPEPDSDHTHIWAPWEDCEVINKWGPAHNRITESVPGQRRDCLDCGQRQVRRLHVGPGEF